MRVELKWLMVGALLIGAIVWLAVLLGRPQAVRSAATSDPPDTATESAFAQGGCVGCHTIPGIPNAVGQVGPDLTTVGSEAGERKAGMDAEAYLRESIPAFPEMPM